MFETVALIIATAFLLNIGASGAAATMAEVYGAGIVKKRTALLLAGIGLLLGAVIAGEPVTQTIGKNLLGPGSLSSQAAVLVLMSAVLPLALSNFLGIPISTSEVTVGAVAGVGLALFGVDLELLFLIIASWIVLPLMAFVISFVFQRWIGLPLEGRVNALGGKATFVLFAVLILVRTGAAFAAGANNAGNAVGVLVGAEILPIETGLMLGGLALAIGSVVLGSRVLETNARRIAPLTPMASLTVGATTASLMLGLSLFGVPAPMSQATTCSIVGVGCARRSRCNVNPEVIRRVVSMWALAPGISILLGYFSASLLRGIEGRYSTTLAVITAGVALTVLAALCRISPRELWQRVLGMRDTLLGLGVLDSIVRDPESDLYNEHHFRSQLLKECAFALRQQRPLSVVVVQLERLDWIQRTCGGEAKQAVLKAVADVVSHALRTEDLSARVEENRLGLILRDTPLDGAEQVARRIAKAIEQVEVTWLGDRLSVRASIGYAMHNGSRLDPDAPEELFDRAVTDLVTRARPVTEDLPSEDGVPAAVHSRS